MDKSNDKISLIPEEHLQYADIFDNFPSPAVIVDDEGFICRCNFLFGAMFDAPVVNTDIHRILSLDPNTLHKKTTVLIQKEYYRVFKLSVELEGRSCRFFYFVKTANGNSDESAGNIGVSVGLLYIDNYQEVLDSMDEEKWPALIAVIDRKLNHFCQNLGAILCKYEKDRYLLLISNSALQEVKEKKFDILDNVRETNLGNAVAVTLSIGIGQSGETLSQGMEFARNALDLALGRGGDQALIKDKDGYSFFGGKTGYKEKNSNVRARVKANALIELIKESSNIFIMGHKRADLDSVGSAVGIYAMASHFGKRCSIVLDGVSPGIVRLYEKILEISEYEGMFISPENAVKKFGKNSLLVVVDTHRPSICECPELIDMAETIVVIDHHRKSAEFIDNSVLIYHEPHASSTAELVTEMLMYVGESLSLKPLEADALLAGITMDTKSFMLKTGAKTFDTAAFLRRNRADTIRVRKLMQNDMTSYKARTEIVRAAQIFRNNIAISVCPDAIDDRGLIAAMAADDLLNISGIQVSFVITATDTDILISGRSLGDINVQRICEKLGGGGHQTIAGAQVPMSNGTDVETIIKMIKDATIDYLEKEN